MKEVKQHEPDGSVSINKEDKKAYDKVRYKANRKKMNDYSKAYHQANKESKKVYNEAWQKANKEKCAGYKKAWQKANRNKFNNYNAIRRARKNKTNVVITKEEKQKINQLYKIAQDATKLFGYGWDVDHIIPLSKGGLHKLTNLQVVPSTWNRTKHNLNCDKYW